MALHFGLEERDGGLNGHHAALAAASAQGASDTRAFVAGLSTSRGRPRALPLMVEPRGTPATREKKRKLVEGPSAGPRPLSAAPQGQGARTGA